MEPVAIARVCARCRRVLRAGACPVCTTSDPVPLFSDVFASARGIRAPAIYDAADSALGLAIAAEFFFLVCATIAGVTPLALLLMLMLGSTAIMLAWIIPTVRQHHRLRLIRAARARALPRGRWLPAGDDRRFTVAGTARRFLHDARAPMSGERCLAAAADVLVKRRLAARELTSAEFLVVDDFGVAAVVCGTIWFEPAEYQLDVPTEWARLRVGDEPVLPAHFEPAGRACEALIRDGDRITATGPLTREPYAGLHATYRDAGTVRVLRGTPGDPVILRRE